MSQHVIALSIGDRRSPEVRRIQLATLFEQLAHKERAQRFLRWMGLDPRQFVLFLELFRTLSEREEYSGSVGVNRFNILYLSYWAALMSGYVLVLLMMRNRVPPAPMYLLYDLSITFALTFLVFMREVANSLFNPVEASMLTHTPIHGPTYAAAKIVHIFIAVLYLVLGLNLIPAVLGYNAPGSRWFWLTTHLTSAFLIGLWTAFIICAFYGLIRRLVPADLLKSVAKWIQVLSMCAFVLIPVFFKSFVADLSDARFENSQWTWLPLTWFLEIGRMGCHGTSWRLGSQGAWSILASILFIAFGLRSFSGTYLSEAASMVVGQSHRSNRRGLLYRSLSALGRSVTGAAAGLGAYCFIGQMIRRDRLFWRAILTQTWIVLLFTFLVIVALIQSGIFPAAQILPHLLGLITIAICINLPTTVYSKASWIYLIAPIGNIRAFARGACGVLWTLTVALPHAALLIYLAVSLNWKEAVIITGYNLIVVSLYLAFGIRMITGLPFSQPADELRNMVKSIYVQVCGLMAIVFPIWAQINLWLISRYLPTAIILCFGIWLVLHLNLRRLEEEVVWRLYLLKLGPNQMFREF